MGHRSSTGVGRQNTKRTPTRPPQSPEVAFIERKNVQGAVTVRQYHVRSIGEADTRVGILNHYPPRLGYVPERERREAVCLPCDFLEQSEFGLSAHPRSQQIIEFRQHEGRQDQSSYCSAQCLSSGVVETDRKSTRLNSSHANISYAVFCLKKKTKPKSYHLRLKHTFDQQLALTLTCHAYLLTPPRPILIRLAL